MQARNAATPRRCTATFLVKRRCHEAVELLYFTPSRSPPAARDSAAAPAAAMPTAGAAFSWARRSFPDARHTRHRITVTESRSASQYRRNTRARRRQRDRAAVILSSADDARQLGSDTPALQASMRLRAIASTTPARRFAASRRRRHISAPEISAITPFRISGR